MSQPKKLTIWIEESYLEELHRIKADEGLSLTACVRLALTRFFAERQHPSEPLLCVPAGERLTPEAWAAALRTLGSLEPHLVKMAQETLTSLQPAQSFDAKTWNRS